MMRHTARIIVVGCLLALSACSSTFLYNQADWLIPWYLDDYVDLSREQKKDLKEQLRPLLNWHRNEELASYVVLLDQIERDLSEPVTEEVVVSWAEATLAAWERIEQEAQPMLFRLGNQLSDEQVQDFLQNLQEEQAEMKEKYLDRNREEYVEDSFDNLNDNLEDFMGRLSDAQEQRLLEAAEQLQRFDKVWIEERVQWLGNLEQVLQRQPGWEDRMRQLMSERGPSRSQEYRNAYENNMRTIYAAVADVLNSRTAKQNKRLQREFQDMRKSLNKLIAQDQ